MNAKEIEMSEEEYDELLDDIYSPIEIGNLVFNPSRVLKELDPIAYRCGMADIETQWQCGECGNLYVSEYEAEECCQDAEREG